jgi:hypothetical protein
VKLLWRRRGRTQWGWDLQEALSPDRCAMCFVAERSVDRFLQTLSYESTNDPELRQRFVDGGGFCQRHGWRFVELTHDSLGLALLYRHLLGVAVRQGFLDVGHGCVACAQQARAERDLARILPDELRRPEFRSAAAGAAFCEPHAPRGHFRSAAAGAAFCEPHAPRGHAGPLVGHDVQAEAPRAGRGCPECTDEIAAAAERSGEHRRQPAAGKHVSPGNAKVTNGVTPEGGRRCLRHVRTWEEETGWLPPFLQLLDEYIALQDYRRVREDEGRARGAAWLALYWTVGASDARVVNDLLPRLGLDWLTAEQK